MQECSLADDLAAATPQERFLCMIVERVGALETSVGRVAAMLEDVHRFLTTGALRCCFLELEDGVAFDAALLGRIVAAVQEDALVRVERAWMFRLGVGGRPAVSVHLKLEESVVARRVSASMFDHVSAAGIGTARTPWEDATLGHLDRVCSRPPDVFELTV